MRIPAFQIFLKLFFRNGYQNAKILGYVIEGTFSALHKKLRKAGNHNENVNTKSILVELWTRGVENMADYKLTLAEKETIILWSEADNTVQIDTFSQKLINRLRKAKERCPELYRVDEPDRYGGVYAEVPKKLVQISFREPISEERREQYARLAKERFHGED